MDRTAKASTQRQIRHKASSIEETFVRVRAIRDGVVCLDTGKGKKQHDYRAVFRIEPVNFALMSRDAQRALIEGFKSLLNGISFPVQILIRNLPHDLSYLTEMQETHKEPDPITKDHITFVHALASRRALVKRQFYLIVTADEHKNIKNQAELLSLAQSQLMLRMEEVLRQVERLGLHAHRLCDEEMIDLFRSCLTAKEAPLTHALTEGIDRLMANTWEEEEPSAVPILPQLHTEQETNRLNKHHQSVKKEKRTKQQTSTALVDTGTLAELLSPASIHMTPSYLRLDTETTHEYLRTLTLTHYPRSASPGWLDYLIQMDEPNIEFSLFIQPLPNEQVQERLERRAVEFRGSILLSERQGKTPDPFSKNALKDVEGLRERLVRGDEHVFSISLFLLVRGATLRELDERTTRIQTAIRSLDFRALPLAWQHHLGWLCCLPYAVNVLSHYGRLLGTRAAATFFCFTGATPSMDRGVLFGVLQNGSLVTIDPFKSEEWPNANLGVFGQSGSGKSFFLKTVLSRLAPRTRLYILDLEGEYRLFAEAIGAQHVFLTSESLQINPLDLYHPSKGTNAPLASEERHFFRQKLVNMVTFLSLLVGEQGVLSQKEKAFLHRCLLKTYELHHITNDPATHSLPAPCLADLYQVITSAQSHGLGNDTYGLAPRLEQYLHLFPRQTAFGFEHPHLIFNVQQLPETLKPIATFLVTERLWTELRETREKVQRATHSSRQPAWTHSIIMIDEAWFLTEFEDGAKFLSEFARRIRKYGGGLWVGTQRSGDFFRSDQGKTLLAMCTAKMLFKHDVSCINEVTEAFHLNPAQSNFLLSARRGEALFVTKFAVGIEIVASHKEREIANTTLGASAAT